MGAKMREKIREILGDAVGAAQAEGGAPAGVRFVFHGPVTINMIAAEDRRAPAQLGLVFDEGDLDVKTG